MRRLKRLTSGAFGAFCIAVLTGCGAGSFTGNAVIQAGLDEFSDQVRSDIRDNAVIVEEIGTIQSFELDMPASEELPGENDFVFNIKGSKGAGVLTATCITIDEDTEDITAGTLKLSSGETVNLFP